VLLEYAVQHVGAPDLPDTLLEYSGRHFAEPNESISLPRWTCVLFFSKQDAIARLPR